MEEGNTKQGPRGIAAVEAAIAVDPALSRITFADEGMGLHQAIYTDGGGAYLTQGGMVVDRWDSLWGRPELWLFDLHHYLFLGDNGKYVTGALGLLLWLAAALAYAERREVGLVDDAAEDRAGEGHGDDRAELGHPEEHRHGAHHGIDDVAPFGHVDVLRHANIAGIVGLTAPGVGAAFEAVARRAPRHLHRLVLEQVEIGVGRRLPRDWDYVPVPIAVVEIVPEYRDYVYVWVDDEYAFACMGSSPVAQSNAAMKRIGATYSWRRPARDRNSLKASNVISSRQAAARAATSAGGAPVPPTDQS